MPPLSLDVKHPALIFKATPYVIHHGSLSVARSLARFGVPVFAIVEDKFTPLAVSKYVRGTFVWKRWPQNREMLLAAMEAIGNSIKRPTVLFPVDDLSAILIAENAKALRRWFLFPEVPSEIPRAMADKELLLLTCQRSGIPHARSIVARSTEDIRNFAAESGYPFLAKATEQWNLLGKHQKYSAHLIRTSQELDQFCRDVDFKRRLILQEFIPGEDWIYHAYCNSKKSLFMSFTGLKLKSYPDLVGSTQSGVSISNEPLIDRAEELLRSLSYSGIVDCDFRRDARDGEYKLVDCNPRVGQNFRMFEDQCFLDVVRAQYQDLTGHRVDLSPMVNGRHFLVESFLAMAFVRGLFKRLQPNEPPPAATKPQFSTLSRRPELAWWSFDDPFPFMAITIRLPIRVVARIFKKGLALFRKSARESNR